MAGGFSTEDHIFKVLAMGAPFTKAVCMGRALMIPGMVGKNFDEWIKTKKLPKEIKPFGNTKEELFVCYEEVKAKYGSEADDDAPGRDRFLQLRPEAPGRSAAVDGRCPPVQHHLPAAATTCAP